jgi:hypothetical protein
MERRSTAIAYRRVMQRTVGRWTVLQAHLSHGVVVVKGTRIREQHYFPLPWWFRRRP